jgi:tetratricopeptide (TPR) repeat protein
MLIPSDASDKRAMWIWTALILILGFAAYSNSFTGPFIFDDAGSIANNRTLQSFTTALSPPKGAYTVSGRPILNLSFAINYSVHGTSIAGYHIVNLLIHLAAGFTLFALLRRTLSFDSATHVAGAVALLWTVHPLQTESVTYIVQRAESLSGLFYLVALYCFARGSSVGAVTACALGIATKETLVTAPVLLLLYDRCFISGSFSQALKQRWKTHLTLAIITWLTLGLLMWTNLHRGGTAGLGLAISPLDYARTQLSAITMYLKLSLWPSPLILDYGVPVSQTWTQVLPAAFLILMLLGLTLWALWKHPKVGFAAAAFFACLAPTSSIIPVTTQTMAEHRMYLSLAPLLALVVVGGRFAWKKVEPLLSIRFAPAPAVAACLFAVLFVTLTFTRNRDYTSALSIWLDTIAKCPTNARAYNGAGQALKELRRFDEALVFYTKSIGLEPDAPKWHNNRGNVFYTMQDYAKALADYDTAIGLQPDLKDAYSRRSACHFFLRNYDLAWSDVRRAIELGARPHPDFIQALTRASGRAMDRIAITPVEAD